MQLAFGVLLVVLLTELINLVGKAHFTALGYDLWLKIAHKDNVTKQRALKKEILTLKNDLSRTSSQDEFAKWAKLRRKMDSKIAILEKMTSELHISKASFEVKFKGLLWFITNGIQFLMVAWYRRSPVFYLPLGWFGPAERVLALPFAERGSVSIAIWFYLCRKVILLFASNLAEFVPAVKALKPEQPESSNPFAAMANMASMAGGLGGAGSPGGAAAGNPFASMGGDFGGMGGMGGPMGGMGGGMEGMENMFGPGSPFAAMFGQAMGGDMMNGSSGTPSASPSPAGGSSPKVARSSSVRGAGNLGGGERRRKV